MTGRAPGRRLAGHGVIVVGAGIVGSCAAYEFARAGADVVVLDPAPGMGSSWGNAGLVVPSYCTPMVTRGALLEAARGVGRAGGVLSLRRPLAAGTLGWLAGLGASALVRDPAAVSSQAHALATRSRTRWTELAESGLDIGLQPRGWLWAYQSADGLAEARRSADALAAVGVRSELLDADAAGQAVPGAVDLAGGVHFPDDAALEPERACRVVLAAAEALGVRVLRELVREVAVRPSGGALVVLGDRDLAADLVVLAAGSRTTNLARGLGERLPMRPGYGWSLTIPTDWPLVDLPLMLGESHVVVTQRRESIRLTGGMEFGGRPGHDPRPRQLAVLRRAAEAALPDLRTRPAGRGWRGARPMTLDGLPIVRRSRRSSAVLLATGHGTLGVTLAPATALDLVALAEDSLASVGVQSRSDDGRSHDDRSG